MATVYVVRLSTITEVMLFILCKYWDTARKLLFY